MLVLKILTLARAASGPLVVSTLLNCTYLQQEYQELTTQELPIINNTNKESNLLENFILS